MLDLCTNFKTNFIKRDLPANSWWIDVRTRHVIAFCHSPRISSHHQQRPTLGYIGVQVRKTFYNSQTKSAQLRFFGPKSHLYLILVSLAESSETCLMKPWCVTIVRPLWHKLISNFILPFQSNILFHLHPKMRTRQFLQIEFCEMQPHQYIYFLRCNEYPKMFTDCKIRRKRYI